MGARLRSTVEDLNERPAVLAAGQPTITRSPSSIRLKSWMALVTFRATRASRDVA